MLKRFTFLGLNFPPKRSDQLHVRVDFVCKMWLKGLCPLIFGPRDCATKSRSTAQGTAKWVQNPGPVLNQYINVFVRYFDICWICLKCFLGLISHSNVLTNYMSRVYFVEWRTCLKMSSPFDFVMRTPILRSSPLNHTYKIRESSPHTEMPRGFPNIFQAYSKHIPSNLVRDQIICVGARRKVGQEGEVTQRLHKELLLVSCSHCHSMLHQEGRRKAGQLKLRAWGSFRIV